MNFHYLSNAMLNGQTWLMDDKLATTDSRYYLCSTRHRLIGIWRSEHKECGLAITQSLEGAPNLALSLMVLAKGVEQWQLEQLRPFLLCTHGTGPLMIGIALRRLEVFDENDVDLDDKMRGAWQELLGRYGDLETYELSRSVRRVTSDSYRRGLKHEVEP